MVNNRLNIKMNPQYNISQIFSTTKRDYLVRSNGDQVKVDSLRGKFVGIYFAQLHKFYNWKKGAIHTIDAYIELSHTKGDFEIVFVPVVVAGDKEELFNLCFSKMPWLAVPFSDIESRSHLTELFIGDYNNLDFTGTFCPILHPNGRLLKVPNFEKYGADCYPFTSERITELEDEDFKAKRMMKCELSLQAVLASPDRDYVISNHGEEIPISALEGKVVGLFFYGGSLSVALLPKLIEVYYKLKEKGIANFEIVLINIHFLDYGFRNERTFNENFGKMPWLSLPFKDKSCKKLFRYFIKDNYVDQVDGTLQFIRKPLDLCGTRVLMEFSVEGYPFTKDRGIELEKERLKAQTIESLVRSAHHSFLIKNDGCIIPISELSGKNVMLFFAGLCDDCWTIYWLPNLIKWYEEMKMIEDSFEVIYVSYDCNEAYFNYLFRKMPWLAFPFDNGCLYRLLTKVFSCLPTLLSFGSDGHLRTLSISVPLQTSGANAGPFRDGNVLEEAERVFMSRVVWSDTEEDDEPEPKKIKGNSKIVNKLKTAARTMRAQGRRLQCAETERRRIAGRITPRAMRGRLGMNRVRGSHALDGN